MWTAKKTNEWILNKAGVKKELLDTVKARKLAYHDHTTRKQGEREARNNARLNRGQAIEASLQKTWKSHNIPISTKI